MSKLSFSALYQNLMDIRADPLGFCIHRSSFVVAHIRVNQLRPSTSQKNNTVESSEKDMDFSQTISCSTRHVQGKVLHIAGSITAGGTSTTWPNADSNHPFSSISASH